MNFNKMFALVAIVFASIIQVGCGTANPANTLGYTQAVNGVCPAGTVSVGNNQCSANGVGVNNNYGSGSCLYGQTYQSNMGSCAAGYVQNGMSCSCSGATGNNTGLPTGQGSCQLPNGGGTGWYVQGGCYSQGPCYQGYAYVTMTGMCYLHQ